MSQKSLYKRICILIYFTYLYSLKSQNLKVFLLFKFPVNKLKRRKYIRVCLYIYIYRREITYRLPKVNKKQCKPTLLMKSCNTFCYVCLLLNIVIVSISLRTWEIYRDKKSDFKQVALYYLIFYIRWAFSFFLFSLLIKGLLVLLVPKQGKLSLSPYFRLFCNLISYFNMENFHMALRY